MSLELWTNVTIEALTDLWRGLVAFLPAFIGGIVFFVIGWIISVWVAKIVVKFLEAIRFNQVLERIGWKDALAKAELKFDFINFTGEVIKWVLLLVFLSVAAKIAGLDAVGDFLNSIVGYLPNLIVAVFMVVITIVVADLLERIVRAAMRHSEVGYVNLTGSVVRWGVWIFGIIAVLEQLRIAPVFLQTLFTGIIAIFVISFGIAFGLGGKETAAKIVADLRNKIT